MLLDGAATEAVYLNYLELLATAVSGDTATVTLTIPACTALPDALQGAVLFDVFPLALETLSP